MMVHLDPEEWRSTLADYQHAFRHIPIVDDGDHVVALASMRDLVEYLSDFSCRDILNLPPETGTRYCTREGA
jgi:hypothetical protein